MILTPDILYSGIGLIKEIENIDEVLSWQPKKEWVKSAPEFGKDWKYLPIEKGEFLLSRLVDVAEMSVTPYAMPTYVTARFTIVMRNFKLSVVEGIGSAEITKTQNVSMATALAESLAKKAAMEHLGTIFGKDLNRKDVITVSKKSKDNADVEAIIESLTSELKKASLSEVNIIGERYLIQYPEAKAAIRATCTKRIVELNG